MEDYSRNVKFEKQRRNIMFFGLYDRYLPLEEALSREISTVSSSQEVFSSQYRDRNL